MLWVIAVVLIIIGFYVDWEYFTMSEKHIFLYSCFTIGIIIALAGIIWGYNPSYEKDSKQNIQLVSFQDDTKINGSIEKTLFYVSATIGTVDVYSYYYKYNGGYKKGIINSENAIIYEVDNCKEPLMVETSKYLKYRELREFLIPGFEYDDKKSYEITVPTGTVTQDFSLN